MTASNDKETTDDRTPLRRGWTTGTCAAAATRAAYEMLVGGSCPDPVAVTLPNGAQPSFSIAQCDAGDGWASAGVIKDAGDDPDVTHGALVVAKVMRGDAGTGVSFCAGKGVGQFTKPGLPLPPGEPAINPVPRMMIRQAVQDVCVHFRADGDVVVEISIPGGEALAQKTLNPRLGIVGGLSILGTTGVVIPFSCAAWIDSIHRGIDVARASGLEHIALSTGTTSEGAIQEFYGLEESALIEMGDFAGGTLKYLKRHPVKRVTIAGGFAKMTKLGQGLLDLHSKRGAVDFAWLANVAAEKGALQDFISFIEAANTAQQILAEARHQRFDLPVHVAGAAWQTAAKVIHETDIELDVVVFDRNGKIAGRTAVAPVHAGLPR